MSRSGREKLRLNSEYAANFKMSMTISQGHPVLGHPTSNEVRNYREDDQ